MNEALRPLIRQLVEQLLDEIENEQAGAAPPENPDRPSPAVADCGDSTSDRDHNHTEAPR